MKMLHFSTYCCTWISYNKLCSLSQPGQGCALWIPTHPGSKYTCKCRTKNLSNTDFFVIPCACSFWSNTRGLLPFQFLGSAVVGQVRFVALGARERILCVENEQWTKNDSAWCNFVEQFDGFWRFSVILEASLSVREFDFGVHIFRAQSELSLSPLLLSSLTWSTARISQGLLFMKCRANLNLSSKLRWSCALSLFPLHLVDLQVSIFLSWLV